MSFRLSSKIFLVLSLFISSTSTYATPAQILIIRHAEKPQQKDDNGLSSKGFKRAHLLVQYFQSNPEVTKFGTPVAIYAMQPKDAKGSIRAIQTVTPLANALSLPILSQYKKEELNALTSTILSSKEYDGKMVLICWEHNVIPDMAQIFGVNPRPDDWLDSDFETVFEINYEADHVSSFRTYKEDLKGLLD